MTLFQRPRAFLTVFSLVAVFCASWSLFSSDERARSYSHSLLDSLDLELPSLPFSSGHHPPNITLIAIWNPRTNSKRPSYLTNFFASVEANAPHVSLLLIVSDKHHYGCGPDRRISPPGISNIQEVCFSTEQYWQLHADYLCSDEHWGCSKKQKAKVLETLTERGEDDFVNSHFRPFRGGVFSQWIDPQTPLWGWCDLDTMLGSFERKFPWSLIGQFDMIVPGLPHNFDDSMIYMSGHLMFFQNEARVMEEFFEFPALRTSETWLAAKRRWIDPGAEEVDYSHFAFLNPNLTFAHFSSLTWTEHHLATLDSGVWAIVRESELGLPTISSHPTLPSSPFLPIRTYLSHLVRSPAAKTSPYGFTREGGEYPVTLIDGNPTEHGLWIPGEFIVHYQPDYTAEVYSRVEREGSVRWVIRRAVNGPVTERVEPTPFVVTRPLNDVDYAKGKVAGGRDYNRGQRPYLIEYLYTHLQHEKYTPWFNMPSDPLKPGETLFYDRDTGVERWDVEGKVTWSAWDTTQSPAEGEGEGDKREEGDGSRSDAVVEAVELEMKQD